MKINETDSQVWRKAEVTKDRPHGWRVSWELAAFPNRRWGLVVSPNGTLVHRSHNWDTTLAHLAFAMMEIDRLKTIIKDRTNGQ